MKVIPAIFSKPSDRSLPTIAHNQYSFSFSFFANTARAAGPITCWERSASRSCSIVVMFFIEVDLSSWINTEADPRWRQSRLDVVSQNKPYWPLVSRTKDPMPATRRTVVLKHGRAFWHLAHTTETKAACPPQINQLLLYALITVTLQNKAPRPPSLGM